MSQKRPYTLAPVRVSLTEKEAVERAAADLGLSLADAIRRLPELLEALTKAEEKQGEKP